MSGENDGTRSRSVGLGDVTTETTVEPQSLPVQVVQQVLRRWKTFGAVAVSALTTYAIYTVDGTLTTDAWVFGLITVVLFVYVLLTLRSDLKLE